MFDHPRNACSIGAAEDSTASADQERVWGSRPMTRPATAAELKLAEHVAGHPLTPEAQFRHPNDPPAMAEIPMTEVTRVAANLFHRVIAGVDLPDKP